MVPPRQKPRGISHGKSFSKYRFLLKIKPNKKEAEIKTPTSSLLLVSFLHSIISSQAALFPGIFLISRLQLTRH